jgi:hypothetical protein
MARSALFAQTGDIEHTLVGPFSFETYTSGPAAAISASISAEAAAKVSAERRAVSSSLFAIQTKWRCAPGVSGRLARVNRFLDGVLGGDA